MLKASLRAALASIISRNFQAFYDSRIINVGKLYERTDIYKPREFSKTLNKRITPIIEIS
jgi:hypothetical protein